MGVRIGNAGAPRWYDLSQRRLDDYIEQLIAWGATSTELVLHHGEADERVARVHVLADDWDRVFARYLAHGIVCHVHAPLHPRFKLDRWRSDRAALQAEWTPILDAVADFSERQGEESILVIHGAGVRDTTSHFLEWAARELIARGSGGLISLELRRPRVATDDGFDRNRGAIEAFVRGLGNERVGICWDIGHDWEAHTLHRETMHAPGDEFTKLVNHVHLHDAGVESDDVHFPLQSGRIHWTEPLGHLLHSGYRGAITLEVRYRFAQSMGEPWSVLGGTYELLRSYLVSQGVAMRDRNVETSLDAGRST